MQRFFVFLSVCLVLSAFNSGMSLGQGGGFGGGGGGFGGGGAAGVGYQMHNNFAPTSSTHLSGYQIQVSGTAKVAVKPQALRLVVALTSEAQTASECGQTIKTRIANVRRSLVEMKIKDEDIVEDFIIIKRKYRWEMMKKDDSNYIQEFEDGFRMQTNLHILCPDERAALNAIERSFAAGVSEVVSFDYWNEDLDEYKQEALKQALESAKTKSEILLSVFDEKPKVLNVSNSISTVTPASQYRTVNPDKNDPNHPRHYYHDWNSKYKIFASHPSTTFYEGDKSYADVSTKLPPMNPMIMVHSTVTLTYESPTAREQMDLNRKKIELEAKNNEDREK